MTFEITVERVRQLLSKRATSQATTKQAEAFMLLYGGQITDLLQDTLKAFVAEKMK